MRGTLHVLQHEPLDDKIILTAFEQMLRIRAIAQSSGVGAAPVQKKA